MEGEIFKAVVCWPRGHGRLHLRGIDMQTSVSLKLRIQIR